jgi:hypothetical protein
LTAITVACAALVLVPPPPSLTVVEIVRLSVGLSEVFCR